MAFIKLNEVTLVESAVEPNILIEEDGEIKRLPAENFVTPQTQADWNETDATKPSFILNKPESLGGKVVTYTLDSGALKVNGVTVTKQEVLDEWNAGSTLRFAMSNTSASNVFKVSYTMESGALSSVIITYMDSTGAVASQTVER